MTINIQHVIFCEKALRDPSTRKLTCQGIFEHVHAARFPFTLDFSLVVWLDGLNHENNDFSIIIRDKTGKVSGMRDHYQVAFHNYTGMEEMVFHFNKFNFASPQDLFSIEIIQQDKVLAKKLLRPFNPSMIRVGQPDRGFIDL
jgi:hypothetical protein